jgi:2-dehydro-3-deoxygluconokinase
MQPEIISMGEPLLEFNAEEEGKLSQVRRFIVGWGGDTSNFAVAASRLGGKVGYLTRVGTDDFGESFLKLWTKEGIDISKVERDPEAPTGIYFISRQGKDHFFTYYRSGSAASKMVPQDLPFEYICRAKLFHSSGISQAISTSACDAVFAALSRAKESGVKISYDPNLRLRLWPLQRARATIHAAVAMCDLVFPSLDEGRILTGLDNPEDIVRFYLGLGPEVVVLKMGEEGAILGTEEGIKRFPGFKVRTVDTSGAGDTFDAAFVVAYLEGLPLEKCVRFANAAAAISTTKMGVVTSIPRRREVEAVLSSAGEDIASH